VNHVPLPNSIDLTSLSGRHKEGYLTVTPPKRTTLLKCCNVYVYLVLTLT
jgi:hypothetical protein